MAGSRRALLLFTRSPEAEARAKGLAPREGGRLFAAFLESWKRAAEAAGARLVISSPPRCAARFRGQPLGEGAVVLAQSALPFGERLASAVDEVFALGFRSLSVVAGDVPAISGSELGLVFEALERRRDAVVLGPSLDGGVYLIGMSRDGSRFLSELSLRNSRVRAGLESALERAGRPIVRLEARGELDSLVDLKRAFRECGSSRIWGEFRLLLAAALGRAIPLASALPSAALRFVSRAVPARAPPAA